MSIYNLDGFFSPTSIAVFGASERVGSIGRAVMEILIKGGFEKPVIPINPKYKTVFDRKTFSSIKKIDMPMDLAVIETPMPMICNTIIAIQNNQPFFQYPSDQKQFN